MTIEILFPISRRGALEKVADASRWPVRLAGPHKQQYSVCTSTRLELHDRIHCGQPLFTSTC